MLGDFTFSMDTASMIKNAMEKSEQIQDWIKNHQGNTKTTTSETRRSYLKETEIASYFKKAGKLFGKLKVTRENGVITHVDLKSEHENYTNMVGSLTTWTDEGSYANTTANPCLIDCHIHGCLKMGGTYEGVAYGPTLSRTHFQYTEKFYYSGGSGPSNPGGSDGGNFGGGSEIWVRAFFTPNCYGPEIIFPNAGIAASSGMQSFINSWGQCVALSQWW